MFVGAGFCALHGLLFSHSTLPHSQQGRLRIFDNPSDSIISSRVVEDERLFLTAFRLKNGARVVLEPLKPLSVGTDIVLKFLWGPAALKQRKAASMAAAVAASAPVDAAAGVTADMAKMTLDASVAPVAAPAAAALDVGFELTVDRSLTVLDLQQLCVQHAGVPGDWHLCTTTRAGKSDKELCEYTLQLHAVPLVHNEVLHFELGRLRPKGFMELNLWLRHPADDSAIGSSVVDSNLLVDKRLVFLGLVEVAQGLTLDEVKGVICGKIKGLDADFPLSRLQVHIFFCVTCLFVCFYFFKKNHRIIIPHSRIVGTAYGWQPRGAAYSYGPAAPAGVGRRQRVRQRAAQARPASSHGPAAAARRA